MKIFLAFAVVIVFVIPSYAQKNDYSPGYIVKANGDSIPGLIAYRNRNKNGNSCWYKETKDSQSVLFSPLDLKAFGYQYGERFESKMLPIINGQVFVQTLVKGSMSVYLYYKKLYVETDKIYPLLNSKGKKGEYVIVLNQIIATCSLSANEIKYTPRGISNIAQNYNRCKGSAGTKYEEQQESGTKLELYAFGGNDVSDLKVDDYHPETFNRSSSLVLGSGFNISSKSSLPKLFINIELAFLKKTYHGYTEIKTGSVVQRDDYYINASFIRLPIGFGYRLFNKPQTPYIKGGLVQYYRLTTSANQLSEREAFGTVTTSEKEISFDTKNQRGLWVSCGFDKNLWKRYRLFFEIRYELTNGFIGDANRTESSTKNLSGIIGIKF